nr:LysR family transcriptional regulator [Saccharopolyspora sp. HNM0983]
MRHLRYFAAVAETRHFGRAAKRLNMAQPPLSQAIRQLEADVQAELLARTTRHVALTPAGQVFYEDATRILKAVDDAARRVKLLADGRNGVLRLGLTGLASYRSLPRLAGIVQRELPGIALEIHTDMLTSAQETALAQEGLDAGLLRPPVRDPGIEHRVVAREPLVLVVNDGHPLAECAEVDLARLRTEPFVMYAAELRSVVNDAIVRSCAAAGFHPHCAHEVGEASTQVALVAAGLGVALAPCSVRALPLEGVRFVGVRGAESVDLALAWRADSTSAVLHNLLATLQDNDVFVDDIEDIGEDHAS